MRLTAPTSAPQLELPDTQGQTITLGDGGRPTLLCFFRDAACPFCNLRVYELTERHPSLHARGLAITAVFVATTDDVRRFVACRPRPFPVIADPDGAAHAAYGIERSFWRKLKAIVTRMPALIRGLRIVGLAGLNTSNLMPADFLIDARGRIVEAYYGKDAGDRIPFERVERFLAGQPRARRDRSVPDADAAAQGRR
ncbi:MULTISPECIES: peroxiredoxin-like family protein [unclassified Rhodanobacter]|jgi:peroxiredoxin|uniref:Peroxiredoxin-like family protein n=1 Tax=Rhodanobacter humi TaxID=1888173 RepID=A0ABV4AVE6_9GAMM